MKLYILVAILALALIGCSKQITTPDAPKAPEEITINTGENRTIPLTKENYAEYLNLTVYCTEGGDAITLKNPIALSADYEQTTAYPRITGFLSTKPISTALRFQDLKLKVEINGTCTTYNANNGVQKTDDHFALTLETAVSETGDASVTTDLELPKDMVTLTSFITYNYEIVEISGTVLK